MTQLAVSNANETVPTPADVAPPRRRRWTRRFLVATILIAIPGWCWLFVRDAAEIRRAKDVRLGQTVAEVTAIMGTDHMITFDGFISSRTLLFGRVQFEQLNLALKIQKWFDWSWLMPSMDDWPVHIRIDQNGKVDRIKRGTEIVEH